MVKKKELVWICVPEDWTFSQIDNIAKALRRLNEPYEFIVSPKLTFMTREDIRNMIKELEKKLNLRWKQ